MLKNKKCPRCKGTGMVDKLFFAEALTGAGWTEEICPVCDGNKKILVDDNTTDRKIQAILRKFHAKT